VGTEENYQQWRADAHTLHELAQQLLPQTPKIQCRISRTLADRAVNAWARDEESGEASPETNEERSLRDDAATLALIGQSIEETGVEDGDEVLFRIDAWLLGNALESADRAGQLDVFPPDPQ
jgi:hypothetical protein